MSRWLRVAGAVLLTAGIGCWAYCWLFLRWTHAQGTVCGPSDPPDCAGISAFRAMELHRYSNLLEFDLAVFHYAFPVLLIGSAAIALYVAWWPRLYPRFWVGIALWLVLAAWANSVAAQGVRDLANQLAYDPTNLTAQLLAGVGIGLGFASLIPLLAVLYRRSRRSGKRKVRAVA